MFFATQKVLSFLVVFTATMLSFVQPEFVGRQVSACLLFQNASDSRSANKIMELVCQALDKAPAATSSKVKDLKDDAQSIKVNESGKDKFLFVARRFDILELNLTSRKRVELRALSFTNTALTIAIGYDPVEDYVYWSTITRIHRAKRTGTNTEEKTILSRLGDAVDGLAVDWVARNLYWTEKTKNTLTVSRLNGNFKKTLLTDLSKPRAIAIDPRVGKIYWTEWGVIPKISSAAMSGENMSILLTKSIVWPNGLAIDYSRNVLYFADAGRDRIEEIKLDGSKRRLITDKLVPHIFGLSYLNNVLYWTDWMSKNIISMRVDTLVRRKVFTSLNRPMGLLASDLEAPELTNACSRKNAGCSHLCFYTPQGVKCGCADGKYLLQDRRNCSK